VFSKLQLQTVHGSNIGLPNLKRQNSWQCQWRLCATTKEQYTTFFNMFLQLPTQR